MKEVVVGVLSAEVSIVQHYCQCWPDFQCETDPSMYPYLVVYNRLCVALCNCLLLFVSIFVCLYLSIICLVFFVMTLGIVMGSWFPGHCPLLFSPVVCKYSF